MRTERLADNVTVLCGDCRDHAMSGLWDLVTDPPYGLGELWQGGNAASKSEWKLNDGGEEMAWDAALVDHVLTLPNKARHSIIWGGHLYALPPRRGWLIWDKVNRGAWTSGHAEMAWTTLDQPIRSFEYSRTNALNEEIGVRKSHPTQKPIELMQWCLNFLPRDGAWIYDPFMGSGTTGVAAVKQGRPFVGFEKSVKYFDMACRRISKALAQPDMFVEPVKEHQGAFL